MTMHPFGVPLGKVADTGVAGFALQNATPTILSYTVPNDGNQHAIQVASTARIGGTVETGGQVQLNYTDPGGNVNNAQAYAAGLGPNANARFSQIVPVQPGSTVTLTQSSALTAGGPTTVWAQMFLVS